MVWGIETKKMKLVSNHPSTRTRMASLALAEGRHTSMWGPMNFMRTIWKCVRGQRASTHPDAVSLTSTVSVSSYVCSLVHAGPRGRQ